MGERGLLYGTLESSKGKWHWSNQIQCGTGDKLIPRWVFTILFWCRLMIEQEAMQLFLEITCSMITSPSPPPLLLQTPSREILHTLLYLYSCKCHLCFRDQKHTSYKEMKSASPYDPKERESCKHPPGSQGATSGHKGSEHNKHDQRGRKIGEKDVVGSNQTTS